VNRVHALEIRGTVRVKAQRVHLRVPEFRLPKSGPLLSRVTDEDTRSAILRLTLFSDVHLAEDFKPRDDFLLMDFVTSK
jgi:hypothetical protein